MVYPSKGYLDTSDLRRLEAFGLGTRPYPGLRLANLRARLDAGRPQYIATGCSRWPGSMIAMAGTPRPRRLAVLVVATIAVAGCGLLSPSIPTSRPTFAVRAYLDPQSPCFLDPDPSNGGDPEPPAAVVEAGDPTDPTGVEAVSAVGLGDIVLPSDRLVVADFFALVPYGLPDLPTVDVAGFTGRAPVCLHIAHFVPTDQRAAFLHVRLAAEPVVRWEIGTAAFGVDGGTGGIASAEAVRAASDDASDFYLSALEVHDVDTWSWANITTDPASGANVIGFSTGYGDGGYPVYAGYAQDGRAVSVVIDLLVLPWKWLDLIGTVPAT